MNSTEHIEIEKMFADIDKAINKTHHLLDGYAKRCPDCGRLYVDECECKENTNE